MLYRSDEDVERYRKLREIHVEGTGVPKPIASFQEASFPGAAPMPLCLGQSSCWQPSLLSCLTLQWTYGQQCYINSFTFSV